MHKSVYNWKNVKARESLLPKSENGEKFNFTDGKFHLV